MPLCTPPFAAVVLLAAGLQAQSVDAILRGKDTAAASIRSFSARVNIQYNGETAVSATVAGMRKPGSGPPQHAGRVDLRGGVSVILDGQRYWDNSLPPEKAGNVADSMYRLLGTLAPWVGSAALRESFEIAVLPDPSLACLSLKPLRETKLGDLDEMESIQLCLDRRTFLPSAVTFKEKQGGDLAITISAMAVNVSIPPDRLRIPNNR